MPRLHARGPVAGPDVAGFTGSRAKEMADPASGRGLHKESAPSEKGRRADGVPRERRIGGRPRSDARNEAKGRLAFRRVQRANTLEARRAIDGRPVDGSPNSLAGTPSVSRQLAGAARLQVGGRVHQPRREGGPRPSHQKGNPIGHQRKAGVPLRPLGVSAGPRRGKRREGRRPGQLKRRNGPQRDPALAKRRLGVDRRGRQVLRDV